MLYEAVEKCFVGSLEYQRLLGPLHRPGNIECSKTDSFTALLSM